MILFGVKHALSQISAKVDLGIKWESVGGVMHPVDYGAETTHVTTQVVATGPVAHITMLRGQIEALNGALTGFTVSPGEYPWGLAYDYTQSKPSNYGCYVYAPGDVTNSNGVEASLTFIMDPIDSMTAELLSYSAWPTDHLYIESYSNSMNKSTSVYDAMIGKGVAAFTWDAPSCSITYVMQRAYAARLVAYLTKLRSGYLTLSHAANVFGDGTLSREVYCTSFSQTPMDRAGNYYRIVANYSERIT